LLIAFTSFLIFGKGWKNGIVEKWKTTKSKN
jgi:hypothetical protein